MKLFKISLCIVIFLLFNSVRAEQISFNKQSTNEMHQFNYQWKDHQGAIQKIQFQLPTKTLLSKFRNFKTYKPKMAEQWVTKSLQKYVRNNPVKGVTVSFGNYLNGDTIKFTGSDPIEIDKAARAIEEEKTRLYKQYLDSIYYHSFTTPSNQLAIKPNHRRIAYESIDDLKPLKPIILESASIKNIRKVSNYVLGFIQSIPYAELTSRATSSGAGYNPPLKVLWENQGDCDSKVTLSAALLRSLMPRIKIAMIYIDKHALIGIDIPPMGDELSITHNGTTYLLAEPTGPAIMRLGEVVHNSKQAVLSGHYTLEEFHVLAEVADNETQ